MLTIVTILLDFFHCRPVEKAWDKNLKGECPQAAVDAVMGVSFVSGGGRNVLVCSGIDY